MEEVEVDVMMTTTKGGDEGGGQGAEALGTGAAVGVLTGGGQGHEAAQLPMTERRASHPSAGPTADPSPALQWLTPQFIAEPVPIATTKQASQTDTYVYI